VYCAKKSSPVTAVSMLSYLLIGQRYRPPSLLSMRHVFTLATTCSTAVRILPMVALNSRCQSSSFSLGFPEGNGSDVVHADVAEVGRGVVRVRLAGICTFIPA
jgi:hypothetical protein